MADIEENITTSIWNPFGASINSNSYIIQRQSLINKLQKYRQNPASLKRYLYLLILIPLVVLVLVIFLINYHRSGFSLLVISVLPIYFYYRYVMQLQDDLILYLLCENNHWLFWLFNPNQDTDQK